MTEEVFERATYLVNKIKKLNDKKELLEEIRNECTENAYEEHGRYFCIEVKEGGRVTGKVDVSSDSAKAALDAEIKIFSKELEEMKKEFAELH